MDINKFKDATIQKINEIKNNDSLSEKEKNNLIYELATQLGKKILEDKINENN